ncbi:hypothetical protein C7447_10728 [Tenacibaculum adriaticum]|uniref:Uncharacterized protein n=1 Tax=Tenacibaculum adriaticum TaxID=413713 RepID=A0A5S5DNS1_9FLAO|nr:hypothetical protein [Tenacibaculum adriaticum]TYP96462.1 hypothetical protein C7447_10728 [Tenacibaculum adriaticum]
MQGIDFFKEKTTHFQSKSGSYYFYTQEGVYRYSNHWGRVASCRWKIKGIEEYKNQHYYVGYSKWENFYPLNDYDKVFFLVVDFNQKKVKIERINPQEKTFVFLMNSTFAHQRLKQVQNLFKENKWATYYNEEIDVLRKKVITALISSKKTLQQIKREVR